MIDIDLMLDNLAMKYKVDQSPYSYIYAVISNIFSQFGNLKKIGIAGGGEHTEYFIHDFGSIFKNGFQIIDRSPCIIKEKAVFKGIDVVGYDQAGDFDVVIVSSYIYRKEMELQLKEAGADRIVDLYSILQDMGINLTVGYYHIMQYAYINRILLSQLYARSEQEDYEREKILRFIIADCFKDKDLYSLRFRIKEYIQKKYGSFEIFNNLLRELDELLGIIKKELHNRKQEDIICFWHDDLRYGTSCCLPFMNECRRHGISFANAYSVSDSTRNTYGCMMEKSDEISLFLKKRGPNQVAKLLERNGYEGYRIGGESLIQPLNSFEYKTDSLVSYNITTTQYYWELIKLLLKEPHPVFVIVHTILETHPPFSAPNLTDYNTQFAEIEYRLSNPENMEKFENMVLTSALYIDSQNRFLFPILPVNSFKIYMSDHGCVLSKQSRAHTEDLSHVPFVIVGRKIPTLDERRLFGLGNFYQVIKYLLSLDRDQYDEMFSEELHINGIDLYNPAEINQFIRLNLEWTGISYRGIRTLNDKYILYATNDESYHILPDEETNDISNENYRERVEYLRHLSGRRFVDISLVEKFKNSINLYHSIGKERIYLERNKS